MELKEIKKISSFGLIKFTPSLERAHQVMHGQFYMNTLQFFIDLEKETAEKGQGDRFEATVVINDVHATITEHGTEREVHSGYFSQINILDEATADLNVYCFYNLDNNSCSIEQCDDRAFLKPKLSQTEIEELANTFGNYLVFIDIYKLGERLEQVLTEKKMPGSASLVSYYNLKRNEAARLRVSFDPVNKRAFIKDIYFKNQNEYRIVVDATNEQRNENGSYILDIGSIEEFCTLCTTQQFFSEQTQLEITDNGLIVNIAPQ